MPLQEVEPRAAELSLVGVWVRMNKNQTKTSEIENNKMKYIKYEVE
jgi:hypothetical protein